MECISFIISASTDWNPSNNPTAIGKYATNTTSITLGAIPYENHRIKSGAIATGGIVCVSTSIGYSALFTGGNASIIAADTNPKSTPILNPKTASINVTLECIIKSEKSLMNALITSSGEGSIYPGTNSSEHTVCQIINTAIITATGINFSNLHLVFFFINS